MKKILMTLAAMAFMAAPAMAAPSGSPTALPTNEGGGLRTQQYHSYDGLICTDCHSLHASDLNSGLSGRAAGDGKPSADGSTSDSTNYTYNTVTGNAKGYRELLKKGDWTDMCLSCHKEGNNTANTADLPGVSTQYGVWKAPVVMTLDGRRVTGDNDTNPFLPAGDFYWSNLNPKKGHNPAYSKGAAEGSPTSLLMAYDPDLKATPPGGTTNGGASTASILSFADKEWSCHSCHGMHARFSDSYTSYRQLKRKINGFVVTGNVTSYNVETITGNETQNAAFEPLKSNSRGDIVSGSYVNYRPGGNPLDGADLWTAGSDSNKNIYRGGFSSYCAACHGNFHGGLDETWSTVSDNENEATKVASNTMNNKGVWLRHPTNIKMADSKFDTANTSLSSRKYGISSYKTKTAYLGGAKDNTVNPVGYDWKYPLVKADTDFNALSNVASAATANTLSGDDRIMCLTCHKAHASEFENMTRWDTNAHAFLENGATDHEGKTQVGDNLAYGCGKCHQKGGTQVFIRNF